MLTRDTAIHLSAVLIAFAVLIAAATIAPATNDPVYVLALLAFYALVFGGAHAYLAWRGEGGMVPVDSRWRFVAVLGLVLVFGGIGALGPDGRISGVSVDAILVAVGGLVALAYFVAEVREGYHERRPS